MSDNKLLVGSFFGILRKERREGKVGIAAEVESGEEISCINQPMRDEDCIALWHYQRHLGK